MKNGLLEVSVFEDGVPPRFRLYFFDEGGLAMDPPSDIQASCETVRPEGEKEVFQFSALGGYLEATEELREPHEFGLAVTLDRAGSAEKLTTRFVEGHDHHHHGQAEGHDHSHRHDLLSQDDHERAHARDWQERFSNREVTTGQLVLFGLTGGLLPCPSAFAVLLVCLQLKQFALGFALVLAFSLGLAITLVTVGSLAALSVKHASKRFAGLHIFAAKMPYASAGLMCAIGLFVTVQGIRGILH